MSETKLLPCPFCGGEAELVKQKHREYPSTYGINCKGYCIKQYDYENADRAIEAWNTRKPVDDIVEQIREESDFVKNRYGIEFEGIAMDAAIDIVRSGGKEREILLKNAKPILFNTDMVRAILDGRKTVTRRVIKFPINKFTNNVPTADNVSLAHLRTNKANFHEEPFYGFDVKKPYQPGDILYVRESVFQGVGHYLDVSGETVSVCTHDFEYYADGQHEKDHWKDKYERIWMNRRPSIHMPKEAARIFLKVKDVRVERLQDINEEQAKAEGAIDNRGFIHSPDNEYGKIHTAKEHFIDIWNSTIKKSDLDTYGWNANPWVWVIEFERIEPRKG